MNSFGTKLVLLVAAAAVAATSAAAAESVNASSVVNELKEQLQVERELRETKEAELKQLQNELAMWKASGGRGGDGSVVDNVQVGGGGSGSSFFADIVVERQHYKNNKVAPRSRSKARVSASASASASLLSSFSSSLLVVPSSQQQQQQQQRRLKSDKKNPPPPLPPPMPDPLKPNTIDPVCYPEDGGDPDDYKQFMKELDELWKDPDSQGLVYRAPDALIVYKDLIEFIGTYAEAGVLSRTSPPFVFPPSPCSLFNHHQEVPGCKSYLPNETEKWRSPGFGVIYNNIIIKNGMRVSPFNGHLLARFPFTQYYAPCRPEGGGKIPGKAQALYDQDKSELPNNWEDLFGIGTATDCMNLSTQRENLFGSGSDNPRTVNKATDSRYLGTLNTWIPYYSSIKSAIQVRNNQILVEHGRTADDTMLSLEENLKLWLGGMELSLVPDMDLKDPTNSNGYIKCLYVAHPGLPYSEEEKQRYGVDDGSLLSTMQGNLTAYFQYYMPEANPKEAIAKLWIVEIFNMPWSKIPDAEQALKVNADFIREWSANSKRMELGTYFKVLHRPFAK